MPILVPNSKDSQFSVSNNRSRSNFPPICRSSYIRRNSTCLNMSTVCRSCRGAMTQDSWICRVFSICREYIGNNLAKLACRWFACFWICHEYAGILWICRKYTGNISNYLLPVPPWAYWTLNIPGIYRMNYYQFRCKIRKIEYTGYIISNDL